MPAENCVCMRDWLPVAPVLRHRRVII